MGNSRVSPEKEHFCTSKLQPGSSSPVIHAEQWKYKGLVTFSFPKGRTCPLLLSVSDSNIAMRNKRGRERKDSSAAELSLNKKDWKTCSWNAPMSWILPMDSVGFFHWQKRQGGHLLNPLTTQKIFTRDCGTQFLLKKKEYRIGGVVKGNQMRWSGKPGKIQSSKDK